MNEDILKLLSLSTSHSTHIKDTAGDCPLCDINGEEKNVRDVELFFAIHNEGRPNR